MRILSNVEGKRLEARRLPERDLDEGKRTGEGKGHTTFHATFQDKL
jgi:hypothetical protein